MTKKSNIEFSFYRYYSETGKYIGKSKISNPFSEDAYTYKVLCDGQDYHSQEVCEWVYDIDNQREKLIPIIDIV